MYEWLRDYIETAEQIDYLEFSIDRNETELKRWVEGDLQDVRLNEKSKSAELEVIIKEQKKELCRKQIQQEQLIDLVSKFKGIEHKILKLKYVDGLTLEEVSEELSYSASHIRKRHAELVRTIKFLEMYHSCSLIK